jgi:hypothetical protein
LPVTFAIIGVQKAATTTLNRMVTKHPWIAGGPEKEMRFFMEEKHDWDNPDYSTYVRPASTDEERIAGDATPEYLFWPNALERIRRYNPEIRLIASFRDPVERAYSQWSMERFRDPEFPDLPVALRRWAASTIPDRVPDHWSPYDLRRRSLFTRGLYGQQVRRALTVFPREQFLFLEFKEIYSDREHTLDRVTQHLGVEPFSKYPRVVHAAATSQDHTGPAPTVAKVARLVDLYRDDLQEFAELTGLDVSGWSTSRVIAGELSVDDFAEQLARKVGLAPPRRRRKAPKTPGA